MSDVKVVFKIPPSESLDALKKSVHSDAEYAWGWQSNLAACSMDEGLDRAAANRAASRFMSILFEYDVTKHPRYAETQEEAIRVED